MTSNEESHLHLEECISALNEAWRILQQLKSSTAKSPIHYAAYRYALIAYARPYTRSDGEHKKGRNPYCLKEPKLSPQDIILHKSIIDLRHHVLAHSDLTIKDARVYVDRFGGLPQAIISSNCDPVCPEIDSVVGLIERSLDLLYIDRSQSLESLAPPQESNLR